MGYNTYKHYYKINYQNSYVPTLLINETESQLSKDLANSGTSLSLLQNVSLLKTYRSSMYVLLVNENYGVFCIDSKKLKWNIPKILSSILHDVIPSILPDTIEFFTNNDVITD